MYCDFKSRRPSEIPEEIRVSLLRIAKGKLIESESNIRPLSVPKKMLGAILYSLGLPKPYAISKPMQLELIDVPKPRNGEVLVKIEYSSLCHSDLSTINGTRARPLPMLLGHEASGRIVESGKSCILVFVPSCRDKCSQCRKTKFHLCSNAAASNTLGDLLTGPSLLRNERGEHVYTHLGVSGFAEYVCVAKESIVEIDSSIPLNIAALFGCAALTGCGAIFNSASISSGDSVCVMGLGAVGIFSVLAARSIGAHVYAVDPLVQKRELISNWISSENAMSPEAIDKEKLEFDFIIECSGSAKVLESSIPKLARGGTLVCVGLPHPDAEIRTKALNFAGRGIRVVGSYMGDADPQTDLPKYLDMWRAGKFPNLELLIDEVPLNQINESLDALDQGRVIRRLFHCRKDSKL